MLNALLPVARTANLRESFFEPMQQMNALAHAARSAEAQNALLGAVAQRYQPNVPQPGGYGIEPTHGLVSDIQPSGGGYGIEPSDGLASAYPQQGGNPLAQGIVETAEAIGADPLDLATVISYETAGTFDPTKAGPTTQWGQHRGLIQFGEPQAREYGVNWEDPVGSQLGPDGAVARYLTGNGYRPGMGLLDLYSTINAGAPGLYNRSDANNGGAPGSVRDKVENQMADHRRNAARLLGLSA